MIIIIIMIILNQVKTALVNKDLKKAGEMEIKKLDQLLSQVLKIIIFMNQIHFGKITWPNLWRISGWWDRCTIKYKDMNDDVQQVPRWLADKFLDDAVQQIFGRWHLANTWMLMTNKYFDDNEQQILGC